MRGFYCVLACLLAVLLYQTELKGVHASLEQRQAVEGEASSSSSPVGGCGSTANGCCADGSTPRDPGGHCGDETGNAGAPPPPSDSGGGVHWVLVITGGCLMVLLVAVLTVSGVVAYAYRHKHKQRQRRQYIQTVLQMYEENSAASSDSSVDDNPEENNLFERL